MENRRQKRKGLFYSWSNCGIWGCFIKKAVYCCMWPVHCPTQAFLNRNFKVSTNGCL